MGVLRCSRIKLYFLQLECSTFAAGYQKIFCGGKHTPLATDSTRSRKESKHELKTKKKPAKIKKWLDNREQSDDLSLCRFYLKFVVTKLRQVKVFEISEFEL